MQPMLFADLPLCLPYLPSALARPSEEFEGLVKAAAHGSLGDSIRQLEAQGWAYAADDSCFCTVLLSPDNDRVLKLGSGSGAEATLDAALALPDNPHLPKVYGSALLDHEDFSFLAEMEFLEPLPDKDDWGCTASYGTGAPSDPEDRTQCPSFYRWQSSVPWQRGSTYGGPDLSKMPDGPLKDALAALADHGSGCSWDVHDGNIMVRPGTGEIVLNDLLA